MDGVSGMFSNKIYQLPTLRTYTSVRNYFERTTKPRKWDDNERPLDKNRYYHYRIRRVNGVEFALVLYDTDVVYWFDDKHIRLDVSWQSRMTFDFFQQYSPVGHITTVHKNKAANFGGVWYKIGKPFFLEFNDAEDRWKLTSEHEKTTKVVIDTEKTKEVKLLLRKFKVWVDGVWNLCNDGDKEDTRHPWVEKEKENVPSVDAKELLETEQYDKLVKLNLPQIGRWSRRWIGGVYEIWYGYITAKNLYRRVKEKLYQEIDAHKIVPYDYVRSKGNH